MLNAARYTDGRLVGLGAIVRALEIASDSQGAALSCEGWMDLVITTERAARALDGIVTGIHEPRATHLAMLESLCGLVYFRKLMARFWNLIFLGINLVICV